MLFIGIGIMRMGRGFFVDERIAIDRLIERAVQKFPQKIAVIDEKGSCSYELLEKQSDLLAARFQQEKLQKERIAVLLPNCFELICIYLACFKSGAIFVPLEFRDAPQEALHVYNNAKPKWLIIHEEKRDDLQLIDIGKTSIQKIWAVEELFESRPSFDFQKTNFAPEDVSFLLYTSGSTGLPKGVIYSYFSAAAMIQSVMDALPSITTEETLVVHDSVSHIDGLLQVLPQLHKGGTLVLRKSFEIKDFYKNLKKYRPKVIGAHINHLVEIINYPHLIREDFTSVEQLFTGGDELPLNLQQQFLDKTGLFVQVGYGLTESIWLTITHKLELKKRGAIGKPVNGQIHLRLVDKSGKDVQPGNPGEIWVKAPMNTPGYWDDKEATRLAFENGWFKTGDSAYIDAEGNYWFVGRLKQIIERNSENITPFEVEQAIMSHPAVQLVGVIGKKDPKEGEVPIAFVMLKEGSSLNEEDLKTFLKLKIAEYKIPVQIYFVSSLPITKSNKINRESLKKINRLIDKTL